jgi:acetyltransferase-like isoleucine patch superfamily enzyme
VPERSLARRIAGRGYRTAAAARRQVRFAKWAKSLELQVRSMGSELDLDAPHGADFETPPSFHPVHGGLPTPPSETPRLTLRIGRGVYLGRGMTIEYRRDGQNVLEIGEHSYFQDSNRFVLAGGRISMGPWNKLRSFAILKSSGELVTGERVILAYNCIAHCAGRIELHDLVGISDRSTLVDSSHTVDGSDTWYYEQGLKITPIVLERNVIVSADVMVLRGVHVERNAQIGGGAVVLKGRYPAGWLIAGNPAKPVRPLGPDAAQLVDASGEAAAG